MYKSLHHIITFLCFSLVMLTSLKGRAQTEVQADTVVAPSSYFDSVPSQNAERFSAQKIPDSVLNKIRKDEAYWYANLAPQRKKKVQNTEEPNRFNQPWLKTLLWIIIIAALVAVVAWYLASSNIRLFQRPSTIIVSEEEELSTEDIFELDYEKEIGKAVSTKNYRLATRLLYLSTLKELSQTGLIEYKHEKTNHAYLDELSGTLFYKDFFRLVRDFEYTWYGQFELSEEGFALVQKDFSGFKQRLS